MRYLKHLSASTLGIALCALCSGCFSYIAMPSAGVHVGDQIRVHLSGAEADRLGAQLGWDDRTIEGELVQQGDTAIVIAASLRPRGADVGLVDRTTVQQIVISRSGVQEVQTRRLDKFRTALLIGGAAGVALAVASSTGALQPGSRGSGGGPNEVRVPRPLPILRWRVAVP